MPICAIFVLLEGFGVSLIYCVLKNLFKRRSGTTAKHRYTNVYITFDFEPFLTIHRE